MFEDFMEQCLGIHNKKLQMNCLMWRKSELFLSRKSDPCRDKTKEVFLLMDGIVRGYFSGMTAGTLRTASVFGQERRLLAEAGKTDMPAKLNMEALSKVFVLGLPVSAVELMKKYPELVRIQNCFFREFLEEHRKQHHEADKRRKVSLVLQKISVSPGRISHRQISSFLGVTPQTLSKERKKLRKAGDAVIFFPEKAEKAKDGFCKAEEK